MSKSRLEKRVSERLRMFLSGVTVLENKRPDWLISSQGERLELDFYIPELDLAIEVQGQQHYTFVSHFHMTQANFADQLRRDKEKRYLCERKKITLFEIASELELDDLTKNIIARIPKAETNEEFIQRMKEYNKSHSAGIIPTRKMNWRHGGRIKAEHFPKYRKKLLRLTGTIRKLDKKAEIIRNELSFAGEQSVIDAKQRRLTNLKKSRNEHLSGLKRFVETWSQEIRIAFLIHKYR